MNKTNNLLSDTWKGHQRNNSLRLHILATRKSQDNQRKIVVLFGPLTRTYQTKKNRL